MSQGRPGDGAACVRTEELYRRHGRDVLALCRSLLGNAADAEDAAQQAFLSAYRALLNGSQPREPAAWLVTIARNECLARVRRGGRPPLSSHDVEATVGASDPAVVADRRADLSALLAAIDALPPKQREALLLRELGGLSYDQLAHELAVTPPAIESLLFRARRRLRERMRPAYAALTGGSWVEAFLRMVSASAPAAATKAVALGIGVGAVTGGTAAVPGLLHDEAAIQRHAAAPVVRAQAPRSPAQRVHVWQSLSPPAHASVAVISIRHVRRSRDEGHQVGERPHPDGRESDAAQSAAADHVEPVAPPPSRAEAADSGPAPVPAGTDAGFTDTPTSDTTTAAPGTDGVDGSSPGDQTFTSSSDGGAGGDGW